MSHVTSDVPSQNSQWNMIIQAHEHTGAQAQRSTGTQVHTQSGTQAHKRTGAQEQAHNCYD